MSGIHITSETGRVAPTSVYWLQPTNRMGDSLSGSPAWRHLRTLVHRAVAGRGIQSLRRV